MKKALKKKDGQFRNEALFERISEEYVQPRIRSRCAPGFPLHAGEKARMELFACGCSAFFRDGGFAGCETAAVEGTRGETAEEDGTTVFEIRELSLEMADDIFMPVQALNELRRRRSHHWNRRF